MSHYDFYYIFIIVSDSKPIMRRMNVVNRKQALKVVKELDAFPKVPESYQETTAAGGGGKT